ncbi:MAG: trigger factor [Firmicutes bacterium]|nr:trigger factor [Bacillota bacterium]
MNTRVERLSDHPARVVLEVEVEPQRVEQSVNNVYRRLARQVRIPGFRPGKAPRPVVERHVGKDTLYQEAFEELIPEAYREAVRAADIEPVAQAKIDILEYGSGKPLRFKAEVDVKPEVKLGQYRGLKVEKRRPRVTDEAVDAFVEGIRQRHAELVEAGKPQLEKGDYAVIDYEGLIDGKPFRGGAGRGETVEVGGAAVLPEFSDQLIGMAPGDEREFEVTFPENSREDIAGKTAKFRVTLHGIKQKRLPELDDEFAKDAGDYETLEELRADVRRRLEEAAEEDAEAAMRQKLLEQAVAAAEVDVPPVMVEQELARVLDELAMSLVQNGITVEQYLKSSGQTEEQLAERFRDTALARVKADLVLEAVARAEQLIPSEEEVDARLVQLLGSAPDEKRREQFLRDEDNRRAARNTLMRSKALDFLASHAEVTEVEFDPADEEAGE